MCAVAKSNSTDLAIGFPPVSRANARVLVLGSLPGRRSLEYAQYYAQPRNTFWRIMGELVGAGPDIEYLQRLDYLTAANIALWDVVASAVRPGSLDARIDRDTVVVNDFSAFFAAHPDIECICFNGQTAAKLYSRYVLPQHSTAKQSRIILPSTSPANAGTPYEEKLRLWRAALTPTGCLRAPAG